MTNYKTSSKTSFYGLSAIDNAGNQVDFESFRGKTVLIVNTASFCGYTQQYADLTALQKMEGDQLVILAFPSGDFKGQELSGDKEIAAFCSINYDMSYKLMQKSQVKKGKSQNSVFRWLTSSEENGWNEYEPAWNFSKYLIDTDGKLVGYFGSAISPLSKSLTDTIHQIQTLTGKGNNLPKSQLQKDLQQK